MTASRKLREDESVEKGAWVTIPRGTPWRSTDPASPRGRAQRRITVRVTTKTHAESKVLTWAGSGGYWKWCNKTEVEIRE